MNCRMSIIDGKVEFYPASLDYIEPILRSLGQNINYESIRHPSSYIPLFQKTRKLFVGISMEHIKNMSLEQLWQLNDSKKYYSHGISLLDLKIAILERLYQRCEICVHRCQVNRYTGKGKCNIGIEACYEYWGTLIGEEAIINPAAGVAFWGCNLSCAFCHASDNLNINNGKVNGNHLSSELWKQINYIQCQTIMFSSAGDPTPNLLSILKTLRDAPENMNLPVVYNANSYATAMVWKLINGLFDVYVIDKKYGNDHCACELAGCTYHNKYALETLQSLSRSSGKVIIRWLLLPGHLECCGKVIVKILSEYKFYFSLVDKFMPSYKMIPNRMNTEAEINKAKELIKEYQLKDINNSIHARHFWNA